MSGRLMKKVLKEQEQAHLQLNQADDSAADDSDSSHASPFSSSINPFNLLDDQDEEENDLEIAGGFSLGNADVEESLMDKAVKTNTVSTSNAKTKKNKKKKTKEDKVSNKKYTENSFETELRRIFGSKVVNSLGKSHQTGPSRQNRGGRRGNHNHRKTILVSPLEHWPRWDGSFSMEYLETKDQYHYFRYVQSSAYKQAQDAFEAAKATHDLNGIANILLYHPYHVDSLITLAEYFKFSGEHQMSADATSKCLYALECAWHPMFSPLQDKYSDDPMGAMFCIDYFALRAEEYTWLERFSEEYKSDNSLWLFPNFAYSLAICRFCLEGSNDAEDSEKTSSTDLMCHALMLHPPVLKKLVAKVPLKDQMWTNILNHRFFSKDRTGVPSLDHLINIYVERSYIIWRLPDLQKFLRNSAMKVIDDVDHNIGDAKDWTCVREEAFSSEKNEYDHLLVSDFSDSVQTMPPDNLQNFMLDPRAMQMQNADQVVNPPPGVARAPREVANRNALAVLLESILPWNHYGTSGGGEDGELEDELNNDM
ncbi:Transcription factor [Heracleum sosnowskyi]|uniref:Transcription factor n=1 Tax=Heracleum sosnowskyi TaxID=360622 RepID=A0AAD8IPE3_9APIA|nr:Transcription factor [Heracleum sosnowskyi]